MVIFFVIMIVVVMLLVIVITLFSLLVQIGLLALMSSVMIISYHSRQHV